MAPLLAYDDDLSLAGKVSKDAIDSLTRQITAIEVAVVRKLDLKRPYDLLLTEPGVGRVLAALQSAHLCQLIESVSLACISSPTSRLRIFQRRPD